jgi:hypothetical protein
MKPVHFSDGITRFFELESEDREQTVFLPAGNPVVYCKHFIVRSEITGAYHEVPEKISERITEFDRELMRGCVAL